MKVKAKGVTTLDVSAIPMKQILQPAQPTRARLNPDAAAELKESMRVVGLLNPITVVEEKGRYRIMAGCRRYAAAADLGWKTIRATVFTQSSTERELIQLHENLIREEVAPTDEARWLRQVMTSKRWTARQLAEKIRRAESWVSDRLALLSLPTALTDKVDTGEIAYSAARELGRVKDAQKRAALIQYAVAGGVDTKTAARWRADADAGLSEEAPGAPSLDADGRTVPVKMMCRCEICNNPHDITETRMLKLCTGCYVGLLAPGPGLPGHHTAIANMTKSHDL
jgi:ParB/RepB/Spo0J family partition protein